MIYDHGDCSNQNPYMYWNLEYMRQILAKAYVPYQMYMISYPLDQALMMGTLFPELVKPWSPHGHNKTVRG